MTKRKTHKQFLEEIKVAGNGDYTGLPLSPKMEKTGYFYLNLGVTALVTN
ncbi:hypothetical protein [Heyndrickxia acidicola]|uniref:Uncharacterized protein n=1 Tax=Heyndrickxia acidicola TaxID=209389 RepID=A0ABU6MD58_9BACI|nr:hypothetical protein [Heyndrickxia acidicola]MED1202229.1 hypothetical protein [Heyndrickxia acidicola]